MKTITIRTRFEGETELEEQFIKDLYAVIQEYNYGRLSVVTGLYVSAYEPDNSVTLTSEITDTVDVEVRPDGTYVNPYTMEEEKAREGTGRFHRLAKPKAS